MPTEVSLELTRAQRALRMVTDEALFEFGLTASQFMVLNRLWHDGPRRNTDLARDCFVRPQSMHQLLTHLERIGYVERWGRPGRGRMLKTGITPDAERLLRLARRVVAEIEEGMLRGLTPDQRGALVKALRHCSEKLERGRLWDQTPP